MANGHPKTEPHLMPTALKPFTEPPRAACEQRYRGHRQQRPLRLNAQWVFRERRVSRPGPGSRRTVSFPAFREPYPTLLPTLIQRRITDDKLRNQSKEAMAC